MTDVVWAEDSQNGLRFEIRPSYDDAPTTSHCASDGQSSCINGSVSTTLIAKRGGSIFMATSGNAILSWYRCVGAGRCT